MPSGNGGVATVAGLFDVSAPVTPSTSYWEIWEARKSVT